MLVAGRSAMCDSQGLVQERVRNWEHWQDVMASKPTWNKAPWWLKKCRDWLLGGTRYDGCQRLTLPPGSGVDATRAEEHSSGSFQASGVKVTLSRKSGQIPSPFAYGHIQQAVLRVTSGLQQWPLISLDCDFPAQAAVCAQRVEPTYAQFFAISARLVF